VEWCGSCGASAHGGRAVLNLEGCDSIFR
jgi:hypothetical protein